MSFKKLILFAASFFFVSQSIYSQVKVKELSNEKIKKIAALLCSDAFTIAGSEQRSRAGTETLNQFMHFFEIKKTDPNYKLKVATAYNKYADRLICRSKPTDLSRSPEQYLKRIVSIGMYWTILYDFLLYDQEEYPIDVNTIEMVNGRPETLLDYLNTMLKDPRREYKFNVKEIQLLRGLIIEDYGAKTAKELEK